MIRIDVDVTSVQWHAVAKYIRERQAELAAKAVDPTTSEDERRHAAYRHDELKLLFEAPNDTRADTQRRINAGEFDATRGKSRTGEMY